jgi:Lyzozyme M1 (1,4-beta-N-acetylmuramidase)
MTNNRVIDLSHWNTIPGDLKACRISGVEGIIHKGTEGIAYVDEKMIARRELARDAELLWGVYHFLRPGSMSDQVDFFLDTLKTTGCIDEYTLLAADHEDDGVSLGDLMEFMQLLEERSNRSPVIYSGHVLKDQLAGVASSELSKYRLWLAHYHVQTPTLPPGWAEYYLWQFTDQGVVSGIDPYVDLNDFQGEALVEHWSGYYHWFDPDIKMPAPKELLVKVIVPPGVRVEVLTSEGE